MQTLRALVFYLLLGLWTAAVVVLGTLLLPGPRRWMLALGRFWCRGNLWLLAVVTGLRYRVRGAVPAAPVLVASKHQSTWETFVFPVLLGDPAFVLKQELTWIPLLGLCFRRAGHIPVDRGAGGVALRRMVQRARAVVAQGRSIVIFPEGTRTAPGEERPYHPGVLALYLQLGVPIVPVAHDSGCFWGRRKLAKRPGVITLEFLEPILPGHDRRSVLKDLQTRIEEASTRLASSADTAA